VHFKCTRANYHSRVTLYCISVAIITVQCITCLNLLVASELRAACNVAFKKLVLKSLKVNRLDERALGEINYEGLMICCVCVREEIPTHLKKFAEVSFLLLFFA